MALVDIVKQDVVDFAAELAGEVVSDAAWVRILAHVNRIDLTELDEDEDTATLARVYLAAHMATKAKAATGLGSTAVGPVTSESVGGIRRTYANTATASTSDSALRTTKYGTEYLNIINASLACGPHLAGD